MKSENLSRTIDLPRSAGYPKHSATRPYKQCISATSIGYCLLNLERNAKYKTAGNGKITPWIQQGRIQLRQGKTCTDKKVPISKAL